MHRSDGRLARKPQRMEAIFFLLVLAQCEPIRHSRISYLVRGKSWRDPSDFVCCSDLLSPGDSSSQNQDSSAAKANSPFPSLKNDENGSAVFWPISQP